MNHNSLIASLAGSSFDDLIVGPKGDEFHHIIQVDIIQGDDDYRTTSVATIKESSIYVDKAEIKTPNRPRAMGGIVIKFWSECYYTWSRQILFHKGCVFQSDTILEENIDLHEQPEKDDSELSLNQQ